MSNAIKALAAVAGIAAVGAATYYGIRKYEDKKFNEFAKKNHGNAILKQEGAGQGFTTVSNEAKEDGKTNLTITSVRETADATITVRTHATQNRKVGMNAAVTTTLKVPKAKPVAVVARKKAAVATKTAAKKAPVKPLRKAA